MSQVTEAIKFTVRFIVPKAYFRACFDVKSKCRLLLFLLANCAVTFLHDLPSISVI